MFFSMMVCPWTDSLFILSLVLVHKYKWYRYIISPQGQLWITLTLQIKKAEDCYSSLTEATQQSKMNDEQKAQ